MIIKPGKYVQRNGGIATVAAVDETRDETKAVVGWQANGEVSCWDIDGLFLVGRETFIDLIREYREPREFWIVNGIVREERPFIPIGGDCSRIIHVREVLP